MLLSLFHDQIMSEFQSWGGVFLTLLNTGGGHKNLPEGSFQKLSAKNIWNFPHVGQGGLASVIFHMFSAIHQNTSKAFLSHVDTYGKFHMFLADNF